MAPLSETIIQPRLLRHAVDSAPTAFLVFDERGRFVAASHRAYRLLGDDRTELLELSIRDVAMAARRVRPPNGCEVSRRELEILQLMADGLENDEIAGRLFISRETVKSHVRRLLQKMRARSRTHAVALGLRRGLIA